MLEMGIKNALWPHHAAFNFGNSFMAYSGMGLLQMEEFSPPLPSIQIQVHHSQFEEVGLQ